MDEKRRAEEDLRIIRSLMERATIYRAISAPTALVGGLLAMLTAAGMLLWLRQVPMQEIGAVAFVGIWLGVLGVTLAANTYFIRQGAARRREPFISPGMKMALQSVLPATVVAGIVTFCVAWSEEGGHVLPVAWMVLYGLALLATQSFAPRSIQVLGWVFLCTGLLALCARMVVPGFGRFTAPILMGASFGVFHLVYAAFTWPREAKAADPLWAPEGK